MKFDSVRRVLPRIASLHSPEGDRRCPISASPVLTQPPRREPSHCGIARSATPLSPFSHPISWGKRSARSAFKLPSSIVDLSTESRTSKRGTRKPKFNHGESPNLQAALRYPVKRSAHRARPDGLRAQDPFSSATWSHIPKRPRHMPHQKFPDRYRRSRKSRQPSSLWP